MSDYINEAAGIYITNTESLTLRNCRMGDGTPIHDHPHDPSTCAACAEESADE